MAVARCVQVQTAVASRAGAAAIADVLLSSRLAACVQVVGPIESRYWWQGNLEAAEEWLCLAKTTGVLVAHVMEAIASAHSYETPEIVVIPIVAGSDAYLGWIEAEVRTPAG